MRERDFNKLLTGGETLTVEFKSDRKCLADRELVNAAVALANTEGGELFLGIDDDGTITGLHENHRDISGMAALIANRTNPALAVSIQSSRNKWC